MKAMLLAAGRGTRLGALGQALPKPLLPICGYPAICFGLAACAHAGLTDIVINLHHHGELLRTALGDGAAFGVRIAYSDEIELLGTGGGLAHARSLFRPTGSADDGPGGPVVVMNAKVVADIDLRAVVAAHLASGADATVVLRDDPTARAWGAISADEDGQVVGILDAVSPRRPRGEVVERMFTGIQIIGPAILARLRPVFSDSIRDGYIPALCAGADVRAFVLPGYFAEHSTPERYLAGNLALLRQPTLITNPPGPLTGVHPDARIHPRARIVPPVRIDAAAVVEADAVVGPEATVGARATIAAGAHVTQVVVWPDAHVAGDHHQEVIAPAANDDPLPGAGPTR